MLQSVPRSDQGPRQAVILAAGAGTRLRACAGARPKPLTKVADATLLEHALRACERAGLEEAIVVVGFQHERLEQAIADLRADLRLRLRTAVAEHWERGNGASALAAEPYVRGPFVLMMCDHIVSHRFIERLLDADDGRRPCALVVDRRPERVSDLAEATKVRLRGRLVHAIGKRLAGFDAVDTGVFLCRPPIFDALREAGARGRHTLTDAVQLLAEHGGVAWVDGGGLPWVDTDCAADLKRAELLLATLQAEAGGMGAERTAEHLAQGTADDGVPA